MDLTTKKRKMDENGVFSTDAESMFIFTPEDARKIIEPFTHDQLLDIIQCAAVRHLDVLDAIRSIADGDPSQRKLFIRGLGWDTTTEKLSNLFSAYGDLEEAIVILDKATGKSKGYGFVTFKHVDGALLALKEPSKKIDGRMTVTQLAAVGNSGSNAISSSSVDVLARKIYVANVPIDMPADRLLAHFSSYGEIEEGPLGFDKQTGKSRGFALFVYKTAEAARASLVDPMKAIDGHQLVCKLAIEGKKGKPGGLGGVQGNNGKDSHGDGIGFPPLSSSSMPSGSLGSHYGGPVGPAGMSSYGVFSGGLQGPPPMAHHHPHGLNSSLPSSLGCVSGGQAPSSYAGGIGGPYGGSSYGGTAGTGFGGLGGAGGGLGGAGGTDSVLCDAGGGPGSAGLYTRLSANSAAIPSSGANPETGHYSMASSGYSSQHHQPSGKSPATKVPPGGMYQGIPPYY